MTSMPAVIILANKQPTAFARVTCAFRPLLAMLVDLSGYVIVGWSLSAREDYIMALLDCCYKLVGAW